ncbi:uncharacterized protein LOC127257012 [Andrographis paniculata]|uniref:uncharacterized protein LOC127257012 n=1 Tax=Andrographis paniculata TaxID=175694 RepID=UPI0021E7EDC4|nr:uncharacterized protein LOC127257012 [Andrographis paniculata]
MAGQSPNMEQFELYFQRADVDRDGRISGNEAVAFLQASNLPRPVLAQIWTYADQNRVGFLGRQEFYNALKLVTVAQSKRDLTPELVKAALYGSASAKIPAPQINLAALPGPPSNVRSVPSTAQMVSPHTSTQGVVVGAMQGPLNHQNQAPRPSQPAPPSTGFQTQLGVSTQGVHVPGSVPPSNSPDSFNFLGGSTNGTRVGISSHVTTRSSSPVVPAGLGSMSPSSAQPKGPEVTGSLQAAPSKPNDTTFVKSQSVKEDLKSLPTAGNGIASDSVFGDVFSVATPQPQKSPATSTYPAGSTSPFSAGNLSSLRDQPAAGKTSVVSQPPTTQQLQSAGKTNQHALGPKSSTLPAGGQSQSQWPRMTESDIKKYNKVFVQVDTDRDGKITGEQARNLFLSWRLPREVLKKVWDLSDQDNDSMLSLREFCIALYLMERYREGRPLPATLPSSVIFDETSFPASTQLASAHGNVSWRPTTGFQQTQGTSNIRPITSAVGGKPPRPVPVPVPQPDEPIQQSAKVPVLEKHLLDQLSTEEQDLLNKKLEEAKDAEKKVADLEKEISEARQKIQFYHAKMQELILYKSRCDNRLNEISERVVADKREVDSFAKKYEEKYKRTGDVASKLTLEEATFRDIQEKKMELYRTIVKLDQENADGVKDQANQIQSDLDELVKTLNERCKTYGLRGKPTTLVELPFGWQPGIAAAAADWDETWDKLEEEGFTFVKELTLEVQNVVAPPKPKSGVIREKLPSLDNRDTVKKPSNADDETGIPNSETEAEIEKPNAHNMEQTSRTPPDSPAGSNAVVSPSKAVYDLRKSDNFSLNGSPRAFTFDTQSEYGGESVLSMDRGFDDPTWGSFDIHYDSDAAWDSNPSNSKESEVDKHGEGFIFSGDDWGLNPIRIGPKSTDTTLPKQGPFFDSVPSTPMSYAGNSPHADNLFARSGPFGFADSVPSTPMYNSTPSSRRVGGDSEEHSAYDSFSRFDSFNMHDSGPFSSRDSLGRFDSFNMNDSGPVASRETFSRFDSIRSSRDSDYDQGYFAPRDSLTRFDSFRSTADSDYNFGQFPPGPTLSRFDSMRSTKESDFSHSFSSFDDTAADPFGSSGPFKSSSSFYDAQTPRKDDTSDLFGSSDPFKTTTSTSSSFKAETPQRSDYDSWRAF